MAYTFAAAAKTAAAPDVCGSCDSQLQQLPSIRALMTGKHLTGIASCKVLFSSGNSKAIVGWHLTESCPGRAKQHICMALDAASATEVIVSQA